MVTPQSQLLGRTLQQQVQQRQAQVQRQAIERARAQTKRLTEIKIVA